MEVFNCSSPLKLKILSLNSSFTSQFPTKASNQRNQIRYNNKNSTFPNYLPFSNKRRYLVFAHFGRTTTRRNSLRKKLIESQKNLVHRIPSDIQYSSPNLNHRPKKLDENIADDSIEEINSSLKEPNSKSINGSVLFNKLESWVEQYKRDTEFWGLGSGPIFTVFENSDGNVERVSVNKGEILRRSRAEKGDSDNSAEANLKILKAESLAREMESGKSVIPRNSSVTKFVVRDEETSFWNAIRSFSLSPNVVKEVPKVGIMLLYGFVAVWALKSLFNFGDREVKLTELEKEMMRRKIKSRKAREVLEKDSVEVVREPLKPPAFMGEKPRLDKEELMKDIARAKNVTVSLALSDHSIGQTSKPVEVDVKIREIREMARNAREIEKVDRGFVKSDEAQSTSKETDDEEIDNKNEKEEGATYLASIVNGDKGKCTDDADDGSRFLLDEAFGGNGNVARPVIPDIQQNALEELSSNHNVRPLTNVDTASGELDASEQIYYRARPRIIRSVKEARDYLSKNSHKEEEKEEIQSEAVSESDKAWQQDEESGDEKQQYLGVEEKMFTSDISEGILDSTLSASVSEESTQDDDELVSIMKEKPKSHLEQEGGIQKQEIVLDESESEKSEIGPSVKSNWNEKNVNEQIEKKIGAGFRDNYMAAREKKNAPAAVSSLEELKSVLDINELDWMEDDHLADIVFRVRENELAGRDPFHKIDAKDKDAFFQGLEKKVERENEKLSVLHQWLHSNIENLDYGADGISMYDPPEKIIPRWKGPILEKSPEFLNNFEEQRKTIFAENAAILNNEMKDDLNLLQKSTMSPSNANATPSSAVNGPKKKSRSNQATSKTIIESSDGAVKPGKKSGKEFWQHTKKWSRGFVESYNAETDPEVKSTMRDIGKDLDRWITEKEIQEAADLMDKLPDRNKEFMEKKLSKLKREMELFGPQAVVTKYREYGDDDQEDYLWWLDLPHILCIELYTVEDDEQKIGLYSLEMATDLELEPKPHHVIAFEDANDCKNLCYIIQAQLEMDGNGHAFVVAQPPKDAFRDAKENVFNVTVIRKGELKLNIDQTLEEVEEQICEIGSKMYHDMIMRDRSVDISSLMKGVFGFKSRPTRTKRKRSKKALKKRGKK